MDDTNKHVTQLTRIQDKEEIIEMLRKEAETFPLHSLKRKGIEYTIRLIHEAARADSHSIRAD